MATVAIIGADGAGKTTIAQKLEASYPKTVRYLYMGANIESSKHRLPTSRLILYLKRRKYKKIAKRKGIKDPSFLSTHHEAHRSVKYGRFGSILQTTNRLLENAYRHLISWRYQVAGFITVYDRHLLFDARMNADRRRIADRLYLWAIAHLFPEPDLVIFLDAPPEVLLARKGEGKLSYLQAWRESYLASGEGSPNFVVVDATLPLEQVFEQVSRQVAKKLSVKLDFSLAPNT